MLRTLTRWAGYLLLATAMGLGVLDGARSLSVSGIDVTSLGTAAVWLLPRQAQVIDLIASGTSDAAVFNVLLKALLALPAGVTLFVLGGVLLVVSRQRL